MLTRRGWSTLGACAGLYAASRLLGLVELAVLAVAGFVTLAGAWAWVRLHPPLLRARRHLPERLQVGVDGRVELLVEATGPGRNPTTVVSDAFDREHRSAQFLLAPLVPGEVARAAYRVPTHRRGRYEIGPLRAAVHDPFGLATRTRRTLSVDEVIVYPRVHDVLPPPEAAGSDLDRDQRRVQGRLDTDGEFHTLREYAPGDDLRRVHWRSTARQGQLMVRQHEARRRAPVLVLLDVRRSRHDRDSFERAVEACASVTSALERSGRPWELALTTGARIGAPGRRHLASVMDELAVVEPHGPEHLGALARLRTGHLVAVVGQLRGEDGRALSILVRSGGALVLVATAGDSAATGVRAGRLRQLVVPFGPTSSFPHAWNEAILRWHRRNPLPSPPSPVPA